MTDDTETASDGQAPTIEITTSYRTRKGNSTEVVEETMELSIYEAERLFEQMLRDSLDNVDARVVKNELEARSL